MTDNRYNSKDKRTALRSIWNATLLFLYLLAVYSLFRLLFYWRYFADPGLSGKALLNSFYWGLRLDITAIFCVNLIFFVYYLFFNRFAPARYRTTLLLLLLALLNLPFLAINVIDLAYYQFTLRRSTIDLFWVLPDSLPAMGAFWKAWWWLFVLFACLCICSLVIFKRILNQRPQAVQSFSGLAFFLSVIFLLGLGALSRGFSTLPLSPSTPLLYMSPRYQPLVSNSTLSSLYSLVKRQTRLKEKKYFSAGALARILQTRQQLVTDQPFKKMNVVVLVLESFAKEYIDKTDPLQAQTPFLDSIMAESRVCTNAYSNGTESNKALCSVLAGIPPFLDEPFYYSVYNNSRIRAIGTLLKEQGYRTNFFMGAGYDHFGFAKLAGLAGIDHYYSMDDYGNKKDFDGNWGIYDHHFLPFAAQELKKMQAPFFSAIFSISTHFPYTLPPELKARFTIAGQQPAQNSMSYLDYSLRLFFEQIKNEPWYRNTLFVFTADHNIFWYANQKKTLYKRFRIPIFFHLPGEGIRQTIERPVQQLDIAPSILDLLHYRLPFFSFGKSVFDSTAPGITVNRIDDIYQAIDSCYLFGYNEKTELPAYLYNFVSDSTLANNLLLSHAPPQQQQRLEAYLKAELQTFNHALIHDRLSVR